MKCQHRWVITGTGDTVPGVCKLCDKKRRFPNVIVNSARNFKVDGKKRRDAQERLDAAIREAQ